MTRRALHVHVNALRALIATAFLLCAVTPQLEAGQGLDADSPLERRQAVLGAQEAGAEAVDVLHEALADDKAFVRRTAAHVLARLGRPAEPVLAEALEHDDPEVRRIAIAGLASTGALLEHLPRILRTEEHRSVQRAVQRELIAYEPASRDEHERFLEDLLALVEEGESKPIRQLAFQAGLLHVDPDGEYAAALLALVREDPAAEIRELARTIEHVGPGTEAARRLLSAHGMERSRDLREAIFAEMHYHPVEEFPPEYTPGNLEKVEQVRLPAEDWRFRKDEPRTGHIRGWHLQDADTTDWSAIEIEDFWGEFLEENYVGAGWYRRRFVVPALPEHDALALHFGAVDESAWIWIDGEYVGQHDIGPTGWNVPFQLDVTDLVEPGEEHQITVRAMNTAAAGGIWQPIHLRAFRAAVRE